MTTATYDTVLAQARQLAPEERRRLREELAANDTHAPQDEAFLAQVDALAVRITAAWKDDLSAVDAVRDQRH